MIEILPFLAKYKYDTWRILPVKCYIDNFMHLWSCIWNANTCAAPAAPPAPAVGASDCSASSPPWPFPAIRASRCHGPVFCFLSRVNTLSRHWSRSKEPALLPPVLDQADQQVRTRSIVPLEATILPELLRAGRISGFPRRRFLVPPPPQAWWAPLPATFLLNPQCLTRPHFRAKL
jgi:hypothetical protein